MSSVRSLLSRVQRLEKARTVPRSPFEVAYGSLDAFAEEVQAGIDAGAYDRIDMPIVLICIRRWHSDGTFGAFGRNPNEVWGTGGER
ncbi:hypothetical protein [Caenibius sp. WL]|uniref:hypothetical protein n=1 Tax=Caenibius sp. WL TaxID=2872646 RepID=UPI001C9969B1|nr:hypothetical protein [Caenibius sp. WL]QZP07084.1 hypothetical protein K5X80_10220 [Caenibius sp. WL]